MMDPDAEKLIAEALKHGDLQSSFSPAEIGELIGFSKPRAEAAARWLSNAGVLELGFDLAANFSPDYQKFKSPPVAKPVKAAKSAKTTKRKKKPAAEDDDE